MNTEYVLKRFLLFLAVVVVAVSINFLIPRMRSTNPIKERLYQLAAQGGVNVGKMEETGGHQQANRCYSGFF